MNPNESLNQDLGIGQYTVGAFLSALAGKSPTPGGGATACMVGALAAAQAEMVVAYSLGKKNLAEHQGLLAEAQAELARSRAMLLELGDEDARAYGKVNALMKLPEGDPARAELAAASELAATVPLTAMAVCIELHRLCGTLRSKSNAMLLSDLDIADRLSIAAAWCAGRNVEVNLPSLTPVTRERLEREFWGMRGKLG